MPRYALFNEQVTSSLSASRVLLLRNASDHLNSEHVHKHFAIGGRKALLAALHQPSLLKYSQLFDVIELHACKVRSAQRRQRVIVQTPGEANQSKTTVIPVSNVQL